MIFKAAGTFLVHMRGAAPAVAVLAIVVLWVVPANTRIPHDSVRRSLLQLGGLVDIWPLSRTIYSRNPGSRTISRHYQ